MSKLFFTVQQLHMLSPLPPKNPTSERKHSRSISDLSDSSTPRSFEDFRKNVILYTHVISFTLYELETITKSFRSDYILGEGGFGTVYKGYIDENVRVGLKSLPVAVKVLNKEGLQGHHEWLVICFNNPVPSFYSLGYLNERVLLNLHHPVLCIVDWICRRKSTFSVSLGIPI